MTNLIKRISLATGAMFCFGASLFIGDCADHIVHVQDYQLVQAGMMVLAVMYMGVGFVALWNAGN